MILIGIAIGFYGYLIPGNINIMVLDLYASKKYKLLFLILGLIIFFESIYCLTTLFLLNRISTNGELYTGIQLFSYLLAFIMGLLMLLEKKKKSNNKAGNNTLYRGVFSMIIHPQQIRFWSFTEIRKQFFFDRWFCFSKRGRNFTGDVSIHETGK